MAEHTRCLQQIGIENTNAHCYPLPVPVGNFLQLTVIEKEEKPSSYALVPSASGCHCSEG